MRGRRLLVHKRSRCSINRLRLGINHVMNMCATPMRLCIKASVTVYSAQPPNTSEQLLLHHSSCKKHFAIMKFAAIIVVVSAIVALTSGAVSHGKRQSGCPPTISTQCTQAIAAYTLAFTAFTTPNSPLTTDRAALSNSVDLLCGSTCYSQARDFYRCANQESYFVSGICGRGDGDSNPQCPLAIVDRIGSNTPAIPTCGLTSCPSDCADTLNQIRTDLGCCAASFYNTTGSPLVVARPRFDTCNINLGAVCSSGAAGLIYLSATLLVAISAIAASIL